MTRRDCSATAGVNAADPEEASTAGAETTGRPRLRCVDSSRLMGAERLLIIRHAGSDYTLRVTRQNKLLLTK